MAQSLNGIIRDLVSSVTATASSGGSFTGSGSIYLFFQAYNRTGYGLLSNGAATPTATGVLVNYSASQKITVSFAAGASLLGEDVYGFTVSGSATNDVTAAQRLASIRARGTATVGALDYPGVGAPLTLPIEIELTTDDHLALGATVANAAALPASPVHGMVRYVTDPGEYWRFDDQATAGKQSASGGYWVAHETGFSQYVADNAQGAIADTQVQGWARPVNQIATGIQTRETIAPAPYLFDGSLQAANLAPVFAITNDGGSTPVAQGTRIEVRLYRDGENVSLALSGQAIATLLGKANLDDGTLDTTADGVGSPVTLGPSATGVGGLITPEELDAGYAWIYRLQFQTDASAINTPENPFAQGDVLTFYPKVEGILGERAQLAEYFGSGVSERGDQLIVLPSTGTANAILKNGSATILNEVTTQGYQFADRGDLPIDGLAASTDGQVIALSGPYNEVRVRANDGEMQDYEAKRAEVGTGLGPISGYYSASAWSSSVAIAGSGESLQISVTHPTSIRSDYPEAQIAGKTADFNAAQLAVLVRFGGTIYEVVSVNRAASPQTITITDLGATTIGSVYDSSASPSFGPFGYGTITPSAVAQGSTLAAGSYEVAIVNRYDGNQVTSISHSTSDNCIPVGDLNFFELVAARGQTGFTTTTADFIQPAVGATVTVDVSSSAFMVAGQPILVSNGGNYTVDSTPTGTSVTLQNDGAGGNASVGATISSGATLTPTGTPGNSAYGLFFNYDNTLTVGAASGEVRFNDATIGSATAIYVSETTSGGLDATSLISTLTTGSKLIFRDEDSAALHMFAVSGAITDNGSDRTIPVTYETGNGALADGTSLFVTSSIKGETGDAGTDGNDGAAATISVGTTTTGNPGTNAFVSNSGTTAAAVFDFTVPRGAAGVPFGTRHTFDTGTTNTPASGELRFNDGTISSATEIYVNETDRNALAIATVLSNTPNGSRISVVSDGDETAIAYFTLDSSSSASSVTTYTVTHLTGNPTFADGIDVTIQTEGKGDQGTTGTAGAAGVDAGLPYSFDTGTTVGAAAGEIRFNDATMASVSQLFVNVTDRNAVNLTAFWDEVNASTLIQVQSQVSASTYALYQITGQAGTTERTFNVTHLGSSASTFSDADDVGLVFFLKGDQGTTGNNGNDGNDGADGADGVVTYGAISTNLQTGTSYTLVLSDRGKVVELNNASAITLTVPPNSSVAFDVGDQIVLEQSGVGQVTVTDGAGVNVRAPNGKKLRTQYSPGTLRYKGSDEWHFAGDTEV